MVCNIDGLRMEGDIAAVMETGFDLPLEQFDGEERLAPALVRGREE